MLADEIEMLATSADALANRRSALIARIKRKFGAIRAYRTVFLDEDGTVSAAGAKVLADIGAVGRLGYVDPPAATDAILRERVGRRALALHIISRLDLGGEQLRTLAHQLRELGA